MIPEIFRSMAVTMKPVVGSNEPRPEVIRAKALADAHRAKLATPLVAADVHNRFRAMMAPVTEQATQVTEQATQVTEQVEMPSHFDDLELAVLKAEGDLAGGPSDLAAIDEQSLAQLGDLVGGPSDCAGRDAKSPAGLFHPKKSAVPLDTSLLNTPSDLAGGLSDCDIVQPCLLPEGLRSKLYNTAVTSGTCQVTSCLDTPLSCMPVRDDMPAASASRGSAPLRSASLSWEEEVEEPEFENAEVDPASDLAGVGGDLVDEDDQSLAESRGMPSRDELGYALIQFWRNPKKSGGDDWSISIESAPITDFEDLKTMPKLSRHYCDFGAGGARRLKSNRITPRVKAGEMSSQTIDDINNWTRQINEHALMGAIGNSRYSNRKREIGESTNARGYADSQFASIVIDKETGLPSRLMLWLNDKSPFVLTTEIRPLAPKPSYNGKKAKRSPVALAYCDPYGLAKHIRHDKREAERLAREDFKAAVYHPKNEIMRAVEARCAARDDEIVRLQADVAALSKMVTDLMKLVGNADDPLIVTAKLSGIV